MPVAGQRASSWVERVVGRLAERRARGGARELGGEQAGVAAADLGERAPRREPGGDRDAQQVEHVGQLGLDRAAPRARAPAQRVSGAR